MQESAGTLLHRTNQGALEVLLVHPSGNFNRRAPWSIPKGLVDEGEDLEAAARRETVEETGINADSLHSIGFVDYRKSRKRIHCFVGEVSSEAEPQCASWEVDRAEFIRLENARRLIHPDQLPLLDRLLQRLGWNGQTMPKS
jgi:predicted NUDIX family NTP pyrophosphohydrolase